MYMNQITLSNMIKTPTHVYLFYKPSNVGHRKITETV